jgi:CRISPR-associated endoribonuclease Cas6/Csy4 subtype I-F
MMIFWMEIVLPNSSGPDCLPVERRMSNLLTLIHRAANGKKFAVGFPEYKEGKTRSLGTRLHLFSFESRSDLEKVLRDTRLSTFLQDLCDVNPIRELQKENIKSWVVYRKSQLAKKISQSHRRRLERRANLAMGAKLEHDAIENRALVLVQNLPRFYHYSKSSDKEMPLFIVKELGCSDARPEFDSFGLALAGSSGVPANMDL